MTGVGAQPQAWHLALALLLGGCNPSCNQETEAPLRGAPQEGASMEQDARKNSPPSQGDPAEGARSDQAEGRFSQERKRLVSVLEADGISDRRVLDALGAVPRHELVPEAFLHFSYENRPLPIGEDQTISQPYIVALMTQLAKVGRSDKVLEIGTGSGYQAAILSLLCDEVYTIEIVESLGERAKRDLTRLGLSKNVHFRIGDGFAGWPEEAPFDAILVTAAPKEVPAPLEAQLADGGRLVIPVGDVHQDLRVLEKVGGKLVERDMIPVRFVPMTGKAQEKLP